ncbi:ABC transporter permease [Alloalcanivorax xenomutans]|jgi:peptide/nickel transport system permease protein|uniref:ABC transporter permease n=1 Tax=Alloalcanivorax xenomutans TaxID=1094342 RepID=A0A9Q3W7V2_9GAMM|nr:ABC transporter permease [Alloalcanivorax xenomutans]ERS13260.1 peptide ABC transporter [Alcanivorax sp. PN-3]KYZ87491.1 glutathione ABC transporter permease [Alcanivorax sp. KX64203]MBA4721171.1 ABC transporter permease [Alcanivorax sp.]ARB46637.1 glutathione ABC transporter permease [Alloalcanivorax xenomutans]MCE7510580.1 ABC transporter permease [Alloalcanivorax xenomutans]|tara:strand:- start:26 stop:985 length:960 start_codon:yes stop_codon:yes gene_type:complete
MGFYVLRRLLALIPTLFIASVIAFTVVRLVPGDVLDLMLSENVYSSGAPEDRAQLEQALGLDKPLYQQYLHWAGDALQGDLGESLWRNTPVTGEIAARLDVTLELGILALLIALAIGLPIGIFAAVRQETLGDHIGRTFSILALAMPNFWLGTLVVILPALWWGWSPPNELVPFFENPLENLKTFLLPSLILGTSLSAVIMRMTRTMMLEVLRQDYIRTAWAKGLRERRVVLMHAVKNAMIPVITLVGILVPILFGGTVIIEQIFRLPGLGQLLLEAVSTRDYPVITGVFLVTGVVVMLVNLLVDLCYGYLDPKVRYDR